MDFNFHSFLVVFGKIKNLNPYSELEVADQFLEKLCLFTTYIYVLAEILGKFSNSNLKF